MVESTKGFGVARKYPNQSLKQKTGDGRCRYSTRRVAGALIHPAPSSDFQGTHLKDSESMAEAKIGEHLVTFKSGNYKKVTGGWKGDRFGCTSSKLIVEWSM